MALKLRVPTRVAFSLIEMLVVTAVILVLAGFLFPALSKMKETGRSARCASNLRQLQVATLNYATDRDHLPPCASFWHYDVGDRWSHWRGWVAWDNSWEKFPDTTVVKSSKPTDGKYYWGGARGLQCLTNGALWGYISTERNVFLCPTFAQKSVCRTNDPVRSYAMNTNLSMMLYFAKNMKASTTILYGDDRFVTNPAATGGTDAWFRTNEVGQWHTDNKGNVVYVDGHVERR